jgi:dipeptidase D
VSLSNENINFETFRLKPRLANIEGDIRLMAEKTSLGADNGIGVAAMLALLEDNFIIHGPIDLLFTVEEVC